MRSMNKLSEEEKKELLAAARSESLGQDMRTIAAGRHNPFVKDGKVDVDAYVQFVCDYNEFINHEPKPFKPMKIKEMKL